MTTCKTIERIDGFRLLFRVGASNGGQGLWYDREGVETGRIHRLKHGLAKGLPMGPDPIFGDEGKRWISVTDSMEGLSRWFSVRDMYDLWALGYLVEIIAAPRYRRLGFSMYWQEVVAEEDILGRMYVCPKLIATTFNGSAAV